MDNQLARLHELISDQCEPDKLCKLCGDLGVNYDELAGQTPSARVRELLLHLGRRRQLERFLDLLRQCRPELLESGGFSTTTTVLRALAALEVLYDGSDVLDAAVVDYVVRAVAALEAWIYQHVNRAAALPRHPYKFLSPFDIEDAGILPGAMPPLRPYIKPSSRTVLPCCMAGRGLGKPHFSTPVSRRASLTAADCLSMCVPATTLSIPSSAPSHILGRTRGRSRLSNSLNMSSLPWSAPTSAARPGSWSSYWTGLRNSRLSGRRGSSADLMLMLWPIAARMNRCPCASSSPCATNITPIWPNSRTVS